MGRRRRTRGDDRVSDAPLGVLHLFAGAGGAALGLHEAGFEHVACVERDPSAVATLRAAGFPAVAADVRHLDYAALAGTIDVLWASPPSQAWSQANQHAERKGADDVERNGWPWTLRVVRAVRPRWAIFENVRNALRYVERYVIPELRKLYPHVAVWTLNAADHGVPQSRSRLFVIAGPRPVSPPTPGPRRSMRSASGVPYDAPSPAPSLLVVARWYVQDVACAALENPSSDSRIGAPEPDALELRVAAGIDDPVQLGLRRWLPRDEAMAGLLGAFVPRPIEQGRGVVVRDGTERAAVLFHVPVAGDVLGNGSAHHPFYPGVVDLLHRRAA